MAKTYQKAELLPCPFCGNFAECHKYISGHGVYCCTEECYGNPDTDNHCWNTEDDAVNAWNTRVPSSETSGQAVDVEALVNAFLMWPLPESVCSDLCATKQQLGRSGTNLLTYSEAKGLFDYLAQIGLLRAEPVTP